MSQLESINNEAYTDVVELCALLQCLGFSVKSLDTSDGNISQDGGVRSVVINCQSSGLHVVLESPSLSCSCPATNQQNSGIWQVCGVSGGKQLEKEIGCSLLSSLPKSHRDRLTKELNEMIRCIRQHNDSGAELHKEAIANRSASMIELKTPDKRDFPAKCDTSTRYRSLDTLTTAKRELEEPLPAPGPLHKADLVEASNEKDTIKKQLMCRRQSTYTLSSTPGSARRRNKTSSPIHASQSSLLDSLLEAEKAAEELHSKLAHVVKEFMEDGKHDSSISSLALDVSKISVLKCADSKTQFASSPNLSGVGITKEDLTKSRLKRFESASTSNLASNKSATAKDSKISTRLRRLSPNIFKTKGDTPNVKIDKGKSQDSRSKLNSLFKPKIVTPIRTPKDNIEASPNLSSSRKKFSHVKSTIPRPSKKE